MTILSEARAALRPWLRRPLVAASAVLSLSVGLAAATSVFAITDAVLWQPLPLPDAHRVVWISSVDRGVEDATSPGALSAWAGARSLAGIGGLRPSHAIFRPIAQTGARAAPAVERLAGAYATAGVFEALGVSAAIGRTVSTADDRPGAPAVLMISHRLWQSRFGGATDVIGRAVDLNGQTRSVVGVMPAALDTMPFGFDWWAPLAPSAAQAANVGPRYLAVIGRLGGEAAPVVERELAALAAGVGALGDTGLPLAVRVEPLQRYLAGDARAFLLPLFGAVLGVVLLAAANAANLLLAFGYSRRAEIAVRASLGASRGRLVRQLVLESGWLTIAAVALALVQSLWMIDLLKQSLPAELTTLGNARLDGRAVLFVIVAASAVAAICGLLPAVRNSNFVLKDAAESRATTAAHHRLRRGLVIAQVALALTVGAAAALMARTTLALTSAPRGYDDEQVLTAALQFSPADYPDAARLRSAVTRVVEATAVLPGVSSAAVATRVPLSGGTPGSDVVLASETFTPGADRQVRVRFVTPGYFAAVGTPIIAGRDVSRSDDERGALVVMVNDALARRLHASGRIVGQRLKFAVRDFNLRGPETPWQVIGVVADARDAGPRAPVQPEVYLPMAQGPADVFEWIGRQALLTIRMGGGRQAGRRSPAPRGCRSRTGARAVRRPHPGRPATPAPLARARHGRDAGAARHDLVGPVGVRSLHTVDAVRCQPPP